MLARLNNLSHFYGKNFSHNGRLIRCQISSNQVVNNSSIKSEVIALYKNLIYLSREWPTDLRPQIKNAFMKNKHVTDTEEIRKLIARGEYVCREITATYHLRKYRAMKRRYYSENENKHLQEIFKSFNP